MNAKALMKKGQKKKVRGLLNEIKMRRDNLI